MKRYFVAISIVLTLLSCQKPEKPTKLLSNRAFLSQVNDSTKTTKAILDSILPSVLELSKSDTATFFFGHDEFLDEEPFREILIGRFLDRSQVLATEVHFRDSTINFYALADRKWNKTGSEKTDFAIFSIDFDDLDNDGKPEILTSSSPNMNGNRWLNIYRFSNKTKTIKYAGAFNTDYKIKKNAKQIEETYEGSAYMDSWKTLYEWRDEMLVPVKKVVLAHEFPVKNDDEKLFFDYYENASNGIDGLELKRREVYDGNEKQSAIWDTFFTDK
ncbi:hypothetical protein [Flavobacterium sp.]|uniref:hypothetical protein n=1 Tax=Flavobacterium sp. TaxID=239 RepID=UPI0011F526E9|nr:hypothetical protein [Flavobacterium sp.]RZJ71788.1 MAG: hypothetical protein EOO49_08980 [Flavobacterium sp.]